MASFWRRILGSTGRRALDDGVEPTREISPVAPPGEPVELAVLLEATEVDVVAALAAVRRAAASKRERPTIEAAVAAHRRGACPEPILVATAELLVHRGQLDDALELLSECESPSAFLLASDVRERRGELAASLALVERALALDVDASGALDRRARLCRLLGGEPARALDHGGETLLTRDTAGTTLVLLREAGRGGAGTVYEARDDVLGRRVAFKAYHRPAEDHAKLLNEARRAIELAGRGVVRVFDADDAAGYLVMEWVAAGALRDLIVRGDVQELLPIERWFEPLVHAVSRVHSAGVVHADLKPGNVLLRSIDEPIVSDFGVAVAPGEYPAGLTLDYASPARLAGAPATTRDDVYSLGRILETALEAVGTAVRSGEARRWKEVTAQAVAAAGGPADATALAALLPRPSIAAKTARP